ncbi:MAG: hypothetical protein K6U11_13250 [bacterium]|nr:hypothetical protein [bacterium]
MFLNKREGTSDMGSFTGRFSKCPTIKTLAYFGSASVQPVLDELGAYPTTRCKVIIY